MQPFPKLPAFTVAITILSYYRTCSEVMPILQRLSHTTRAYCYYHKMTLQRHLVPNCLAVITKPLQSRGDALNHLNESQTFVWPPQYLLDQIKNSSRPVRISKLTIHYAECQNNHRRVVEQMRQVAQGDEVPRNVAIN